MNDEPKMRLFHAIAILALVCLLAMTDIKTPEPVTVAFPSLSRSTDQLINEQNADTDKSLSDRFSAVDSDADRYNGHY